MKRILIIGCSGGGKSTLAAKMAEILHLPLIYLDLHFWQPGWNDMPRDKWNEIVKNLISGNEWIIDGNYGSTLEMRAQRADTILFLDMPRWLCMISIFKRVFKYYGKSRPDLPDGCPECFNWDFTKWVWRFNKNERPKIIKVLDNLEGRNVIVFKRRFEIADFLENLKKEQDLSLDKQR